MSSQDRAHQVYETQNYITTNSDENGAYFVGTITSLNISLYGVAGYNDNIITISWSVSLAGSIVLIALVVYACWRVRTAKIARLKEEKRAAEVKSLEDKVEKLTDIISHTSPRASVVMTTPTNTTIKCTVLSTTPQPSNLSAATKIVEARTAITAAQVYKSSIVSKKWT